MSKAEKIKKQIEGIQQLVEDVRDLISLEVEGSDGATAEFLWRADNEVGGAWNDLQEAVRLLSYAPASNMEVTE